MKKIMFMFLLLAFVKAGSQSLPNGSFESWNTLAYEEPTGWNTGNTHDVPRMGMASITKVTGFSGSALRIQTNCNSADTSESYIINTNSPCSEPDQWTGGVPYTQQPTGITGKYRYNLLGNDTAVLLIIFRKNGAHIGDNWIKIRGNGSQSTFATFNFTLTCNGVPDSVIIAAATTAQNSTNNNGSFLELDELAFTGASQAIPNGNFESWVAQTYDQPTGWKTWGRSATRSTSAFSGAAAIRLETKPEDCGYVDLSGVTTGRMTDNSGPAGGLPYTRTSDTLTGYYKYTAMGGDSAVVYINLSKNGTNIYGAKKLLPPSASYAYFQLPFNAGSAPDTMRIDIQSSDWPVSIANSGSVLYIDNLSLRSNPLGIFEPAPGRAEAYAYPNPSQGLLFFKTGKSFNLQKIEMYDATGRLLKSMIVTANTSPAMDIANLANGLYYCVMYGQGQTVKNKIIKF